MNATSAASRFKRLKGNDLLKSTGASLAIRLLDRGIAYVMTALLALYLSLPEFGEYSFYLSIATMLMIPASFGLPALLMRETARLLANDERDRIGDLKSWAYRRATFSALPIVAVALGVFLFVPLRSGNTERLTPLLSLALLAITPYSTIRAAILRGMDNVIGSQLTLQIVRPFVQSVLIGALLLLGLAGLTIVPATSATTMAAAVLGSAAAWVMGFYQLRRSLGAGTFRAAKRPIEIKGWRSSMAALGLADAMSVIDSQLGVFLLGLLSTQAEAGQFKIAAQGAMVVSLGYVATNVALIPKIARQWAAGEKETVRRLVARGSKMALLLGLPPAIVFAVAGGPLLAFVFGKDYGAAGTALAILSVGQLAICAIGSSSVLLNMTGNEKFSTGSFGIAVLANALISVILIPKFGVEGAAVASFVSILIRIALMWSSAMFRTGINTGFWARPH